MVSHELRTPLTSQQLLLDRLTAEEGSEALSPRTRQIMERLANSTARLTDLVDSLLHHARVQSGKLTTHPERFDLREVADAAVEELRPQAQRKGLTLALEAPSTPLPMNSDPRLLRLALVNLVSNGLKFTDKGSVIVSLEAEGEDEAVIQVRDTGPGIAAAELERVFEPFHQLEPMRHKHLPGVGLGLSLVREIVENLGGVVELKSEIDQGSAFIIRVPRTAPASPEPSTS
jgi:signal transduction histidine kinase